MAQDLFTSADEWHDRTVVDRDGDKIGKVDDIYFDNDTQKPEWARVHTGLFGTKVSMVPITQASLLGDDISVPYEKALVKDAPNVGTDEELSQDEEARLSAHYGLSYSENRSDSGLPEGGGQQVDAQRSKAGDAMTRSEEELHVGTTRRPSELVRLKKRIVTENQTVTVPVQHEEVRIEREPITDANRTDAMSGAELTEEEASLTLNQEEVVVQKRVVPKEQVRLSKEVTTEQREVDETVRKEQIDIERGGTPDK